MQTFLPYADFNASAGVLDRQRLGKQRIEVLQILRVLAGDSTGWRAHPAVKMWRGWEHLLVDYGLAVCTEWVRRDYMDTRAERIAQFDVQFHAQRDGRTPWWLGNEQFHLSHRSNLVRKMPGWYGPVWPNTTDDLPYVWPGSEA